MQRGRREKRGNERQTTYLFWGDGKEDTELPIMNTHFHENLITLEEYHQQVSHVTYSYG
jgi:hypothetical protein